MPNIAIQKHNTKRSFGGKLMNKFKMIDMYGKPIVMTFDGSDKFHTLIGAFISLLILGVLAVYVALQLTSLISRSNTSMSKNTIFKDLNGVDEVHKIGEEVIMFGFSIDDDNGGDLVQDPSYVSYSFNQVSQIYTNDSSGNSVRSRTKTAIEMDFCGGDAFDGINSETVVRLGVDKFNCPKYNNYTVAGNYYSKRFDYIEIKFYK